jgi:hypothetical protein
MCGRFHIVAEGLRVYVEDNDTASHRPRATKARLAAMDPELYAYVERLFLVEFSKAA